jgi:hypothetical protein
MGFLPLCIERLDTLTPKRLYPNVFLFFSTFFFPFFVPSRWHIETENAPPKQKINSGKSEHQPRADTDGDAECSHKIALRLKGFNASRRRQR